MSGTDPGMEQPDPALWCLAVVARLHGVPVDESRLRMEHAPTGQPAGKAGLLRAARRLGFHVRPLRIGAGRVGSLPFPAIAEGKEGQWLVIAACREGRVLLYDPAHRGPREISLGELGKILAGRVILLKKRSPSPEQARFGLSWLLASLGRYRRHLAEVLTASFFLQLLGLATPLFFQVVIDKVLVHKGLTTLDVLALGFLLVVLFEALLGGLRNWLLAHTGNRIDAELGARLYRHLLALPLSYFRARRAGDSVARVRELDRLREFFTGSALTLVLDLFFTGVFLAVMLLYSVTLTLVVLAFLPAYVLLSLAITPILRRRLEEKFRRGAENQAFLVESVSGIETLKGMGVEPHMQQRWEEQLAAYLTESFRTTQLGNIAGQTAGLLGKLTTLAILWLGAHQVMEGSLTIGELVAFNMLAGQVNGPILRLVRLWQDFQQAAVSSARLGDILNSSPEQRPADFSSPPPPRGAIRFEGVTFRYRDGDPPILHGLDLELPAGSCVGIVGRSGSGKSTLARLLPRLYVPESGRILIDGLDVGLLDPRWLRRQIGLVAQENLLFRGTIRENIALACPDASLERVMEAARLAAADEFIQRLPQGYDTEVSEMGMSLSGGQRQRIAIARTLITRPRILILDEASAALDYESERRLQENLARLREGRTLILVAHRLATLRLAEHILVLDEGRIVEQGSHQELLRNDGLYARLHRLQNGDPTLEMSHVASG